MFKILFSDSFCVCKLLFLKTFENKFKPSLSTKDKTECPLTQILG